MPDPDPHPGPSVEHMDELIEACREVARMKDAMDQKDRDGYYERPENENQDMNDAQIFWDDVKLVRGLVGTIMPQKSAEPGVTAPLPPSLPTQPGKQPF